MKVKALLKALKKLPPDADLMVDGPDFGGFDVCWCAEAFLSTSPRQYRLKSGDKTFYYVLNGFDDSKFEYEKRLGTPSPHATHIK